MSTLTVTAERLVIHEHPNADALELAQVGLYRAVVPKGVYRTGDVAVYIPEQAVLPDPLIEELGLVGRLGGKDHNRVRAVRLRGEVSQGIVCLPRSAILAWFGAGGPYDGHDLEYAREQGIDFAELLGITKWVPPIPVHMGGEVQPAAELLPWVDIENIKRYPEIFEPGEPVTATEKIHGTCCLATVTADGAVLVTSKGFGKKSLAIVESPANLHWRAVRAHGVAEVARAVLEHFAADRVGIFGEVYGTGVQDLGYGVAAGQPGYAVFDIAVDVPGQHVRWLDPAEVTAFAGDLPVVPTLYDGPYDEALLLDLAEGKTVLGGTAHLREGIVVRPATERYSPVLAGRAIGKIVSNGYLTRRGGTEYE